MRRALLILFACLALPACATRGPLNVDCAGFAGMLHPVPRSPLIDDIHSDVDLTAALAAPDQAETQSPLEAALREAASAKVPLANALAFAAQPTDVLLLSGGGQWGAFGVGFLDGLRTANPTESPRPFVVTGVSTGALQTLFFGATPPDLAGLKERYLPSSESEIVSRNPQWMAILTGSVAGLKPLKKRIEAVLCKGGDPAKGCPGLDNLARFSAPHIFIGFVEAAGGDMVYADVRALARLGGEHGQQCVVGAALASAAMPAFFQQVRVDGRTYLDGGVRQSVFVAEIGRSIAKAAEQAVARQDRPRAVAPSQAERLRMLAGATPTVYVVRNGPIVVMPDSDADEIGNALTSALRAEAIVVNELEIGSIAELRLTNPLGEIKLVTADGYKERGKCEKPEGLMFDPTFMQCLMSFGEARAREEDKPWQVLRKLSVEGQATRTP